MIQNIKDGLYDRRFAELYADETLVPAQRERAAAAAEKYLKLYEEEPEYMISSPGRTEVCGNHLDHQRGCVIAAAVNTDILTFASRRDDFIVNIFSEGYGKIVVDLNDLSIQKKEIGKSAAMVRGIAAAYREFWITVRGFNAYMTSNVPVGSGISSSAAFENAVANVFAAIGGRNPDASDIAKVGKYAENKYFGKPSGLMDQMAAAYGGLIYLDFEKEEYPRVEKIDCNFSDFGLNICIVNTGASHANLTDAYAEVPAEMKKVASFFGKKTLRDVEAKTFYDRFARVRAYAGDRAVLRAIHFFEESERVAKCKEALITGDKRTFLQTIRESGNSSWKYLQNIYTSGAKKEQSVALALAYSEKMLGEEGACRVHGGGFAGTIQAFVPEEKTILYKQETEKIFGKNSCRILQIRNSGGCVV